VYRNKKNKKHSLLLAAAILLGASVGGVGLPREAQAGSVTKTVTLSSVRAVRDSDRIAVYTVEAVTSPVSGCGTGYYSWDDAASGRDNALTILMAAFLSGRQVVISIDDTYCGDAVQPRLTAVRII